jgi:hypothetical protein
MMVFVGVGTLGAAVACCVWCVVLVKVKGTHLDQGLPVGRQQQLCGGDVQVLPKTLGKGLRGRGRDKVHRV